MKRLFFGLLTLLSVCSYAQDSEKKITVKTYGFVGFDAIHDTRQSVSVRHNHVYLYPLNENLDANGKDINDRSKTDMGIGISRLGFAITGPDAFGATTSAKIEGDFLGAPGNSKDYMLRIRHAFFNLKWNKSSLLIGQTWHPLFVPENYPAMVNFVVGAPIHPISRAPQIRYTYQASSDFSVALYAMSQGDFKNSGALEQTEYANIPEMNVQFKYGSPKKFFAASTFGFKQVLPKTLDDAENYLNENVTSFHANLSLRYTTPAVTFKAEGAYGGNMTNLVMIGGLARKTENGNAVNGEYEAIRTSAVWTDIHTNGKKVKFGLFAGITNNLGTANESSVIEDEIGYTRGYNIASVTAVSPRVVWTSGKVNIGLELLHTIAAYGDDLDEKSKPINTRNFSNNRLTLGCRYNF
ncbi:DcaP family trimeric outer membrane transporter [Labilibacter marinus]|uniref:DcaP family trimeric outer membrane transporter n=1 Tax=Labilibacter marinus TaxID=1477105 RepID=UPI00094FAC56|nr:DcaP family trimeric outer membrane transporter [Labilibacter marinus]